MSESCLELRARVFNELFYNLLKGFLYLRINQVENAASQMMGLH
jgi:hypothetical protein